MSAPVLVADGITRTLDAEVPVTLVDRVSLRVERGESVAITGPSGSGKSSLLYLLGLLDVPTSGKILLQGQDTSSLDDDEMAELRLNELGFVFQSHFLLPEFTAMENVMLPIQRRRRVSEADAKQTALGILDELGLAAQANKYPHQLSGGQNQRVSIARALANDPALILADEPTGNLDTASSANVQKILLSLARERDRAVVIVTHDPKFAAAADRTITIVDGRLAMT